MTMLRELLVHRFARVLLFGLMLLLSSIKLIYAGQTPLHVAQATATEAPPLAEQLATAERRADEARSLARTNAALLALNDQSDVALALALEANQIENPSAEAVRVLYEASRSPIIHRFQGHTDWVQSVAFSPDGQTALSASSDHTLILWDVETGEPLRHFIGHADFVSSVSFS